MLAVKLAGGLLIIGASSLLGYCLSLNITQRETDLYELKKALTLLKNEIRYGLTPFGEAATEVSERVTGAVSLLFAEAGKKAMRKKGADAFDIWSTSVQKVEKQSYFSKEDMQALTSMGRNLGYLDAETQMKSIDLLIEYIDGEVKTLSESGDKQKKMYRSLGVLTGLLITIVLI